MPEPVHLAWDLTLPTADLDAAWRVFSDTDRFNRAAGLGFRFTDEPQADGSVLRIGQVQRMGMTLTWVEEPFQLVAPHWFRSVRHFRNGPLQRLVSTLRLRPGRHVHLSYEVDLYPRHWAVRPLVLLDATTSIYPNLERTLDAAASQLGAEPDPFDATPPLLPEARRPLAALDDLASAPFLVPLLETGDLRELDRLRPVALAARWGLLTDTVVEDFARAVQDGVLDVRFDLLCPSCLGASVRLSHLDLRPGEVHCPSCHIAYDGTLPDSVEVTFRPTPQVRVVEVPLDCVHSPARTPHLRARLRVPAGDEVCWRGELEEGGYLLTVPGRDVRASLEVRRGLRASVAAVDITTSGITPDVLRVGPGALEIAVRSRLPHDTWIQLERRWRPEGALSVAELLRNEAASQRLADRLPPDLLNTLEHGGVLVIDGRARPEALSRAHATLLSGPDAGTTFELNPESSVGPLVHMADDCLIAVFPHAYAALEAVRTLVPAPHLAIAIDVGTVHRVRSQGQIVPGGAVVQRAMDVARDLGVGRVGFDALLAEHVEMSAALERTGWRLRQHPDAHRIGLDVPLPIVATQDMPQTLGERYRLAEEIGRGGMGVVHVAIDEDTGRTVVIKTLLPAWAANPSHVQRFFWEARVTASLDHPNTVRVYDHGADGPHAWLVMERLHGVELGQRLERGTLPLERAVAVTLGLLEGLHAAHSAGIVHRDVKPANVFLCQDPRPDHPKVLDFGIAIALEDDLDALPAVATPRYAAPEQAAQGRLDARTDLYAVGLVLYEMLTGDLPFPQQDALAMLQTRQTAAARPLNEVAPHVPSAIVDVVMRALNRDPDARWPDARAMAVALRAALEEPEPSA